MSLLFCLVSGFYTKLKQAVWLVVDSALRLFDDTVYAEIFELVSLGIS